MNRIVKYTCICLMCWLSLLSGKAQQKPDIDLWFLKARDAAHSERWEEARKLCRGLLVHYPDNHDIVILMGRTYAWELKTDSARMMISPLLDVEPDNYEVLTLLADNEVWGGQYDRALEWLNMSLDFYPSDEDFLFKKANTYYLRKDNVNAIKVLHELLTVNPDHIKGNDLLNTILPAQMVIDELYTNALQETNAGNWSIARQYCRKLLALDPEHFDASLLMAHTFAFEQKFDSARIISSKLYDVNPNDYGLLDMMINTEIWNRKYKAALTQVERALAAWPNDENFLFQKAKIQYLSKDYKYALKTLDELLAINPNHEDGNALKKNILENHRFKDYVFVEEYFELFKKPHLSRKLITSTGISKWTKYGTYIARVNVGHETGRDFLPYKIPAYQYEFEAYQQLFPTNYLYLDYAWSWYLFFPNHRGGFEFFQRLPKGFEASLGARFLYWTDITWFYTGSLSWLHNKNYMAVRPFFCHQNSRWVDSYVLTYRRYFSEKEDYVYVSAGYGNYSDDFLQLDYAQRWDYVPGKSYMAQIGILKFITVRWFFLASMGYAYDDGYRNRFQASAGVRYYFNMFR